MASRLPYYKVYPGDEKRNGSRQISLRAEGLLKRLKDEAHDTEPRGYFSQNRHPMTQEHIANLCGLSPDEFLACMPELARAKLVASASDGTWFVPEIVRQETQSKTSRKTGRLGGNPRLKRGVKGRVKAPLKPDDNELEHESENGVVGVPEALKANKPEILLWLRYKCERGENYKPMGLKALWSRLLAIPEERRKEAIEASMASNWAGIFPPKENRGTVKAPKAGDFVPSKQPA